MTDILAKHDAALAALHTLRLAGHEAYLVGGCVRDRLLGRDPKDFDITTNALPEQVQALFSKTVPVGAKFGVVVVIVDGQQMEIATFRTDGDYSDGRRPDSVSYSTDVKDDVQRRDFTINGLLHDDLRVIDLVGGLDDIHARQIRAIGRASDRFEEDSLRLLRAIRFAVQLGFTIEASTWASICCQAETITRVSPERIRDEFFKMITSPEPYRALEMLSDCGMIDFLFPDLMQAGWSWFMRRLKAVTIYRTDPIFMLALICAGAMNFDQADYFISRFRLSNHEVEKFKSILRNHQELWGEYGWDLAERKRFRRQLWFNQTLELFRVVTHHGPQHPGAQQRYREARERFRALEGQELNPVLFVNGDDLKAMGFVPGPVFRTIITECETKQLNGEFTSRSEALALVAASMSNRFRKDVVEL